MNQIYKTQNTEINYDRITQKAQIKSIDDSTKPNSIAMICFKKDGRGIWDKIHCFCLKNLCWNWIKVEGHKGAPNSTQLVKIDNLSSFLGLKSKEIRKLNKAGSLYEAICTKNEELNLQAAHQIQLDKFNENQIQNPNELAKIVSYIKNVEDNQIHDFYIYFNPRTKKIDIADRNGGRSFVGPNDIKDSYQMKGSLFSKDGKLYLEIQDIPQLKYSEDDADLMRKEVLDIYKKSK